MPVDVAILVATALLAVVAVTAAVIAVRASRRVSAPVAVAEPTVPPVSTPESGSVSAPSGADVVPSGAHWRDTPSQNSQSAPLAEKSAPLGEKWGEPARVVEGRVIVQPTAEQVAQAALTRPSVRFSALLHGVAHALRPESRDRISALMRRSYRDRRRARLRAGRRAVRAAHPTPPSQQWLGELPEVRDP